MLADDQLGATRDSPADLEPYLQAFETIAADPNQLLVVATSNDRPVATLQLTIIPGLARRGHFVGKSKLCAYTAITAAQAWARNSCSGPSTNRGDAAAT